MTEDDRQEEELGRSRTRVKTERVATETALKKLALRLTQLRQADLVRLAVEPALCEAVASYQQIKSAPAQGRHLRFLRNQLRASDWLLLQRKLDLLLAGSSEAVHTGPVADWATKLPITGDEGLSQFLTAYPEADRNRLRQLVRAVRTAPEAKRAKISKQLESLIETTLRDSQSAQGSPDGDGPILSD